MKFCDVYHNIVTPIESRFFTQEEQGMEDYQIRVTLEQSELQHKITKLVAFLQSGITIKAEERQLLEEQVQHMRAYSGVLKRRIEAFQ